MAQKIQTLLTDDLDPELEATETIIFGLDSASYEIDLNDEHSSQMRDAFGPFVAAARKVGGRPAARRSAKAMADTPSPSRVDRLVLGGGDCQHAPSEHGHDGDSPVLTADLSQLWP